MAPWYRIWFIYCIILVGGFWHNSSGQTDTLDQAGEPLIKHIPLVEDGVAPDSNYVEVLPNLWSIRVLAIAKSQGLAIRNQDGGGRVRYRPTNPLSLGLGFSYKFLVIDIGVNLRLKKDEATERFDFQGSILGRRYLFDAFLQVYTGYRLVKSEPPETEFRDDINVTNLGVNFFRTFGGLKLSLRSAFVGNEIQRKTAGAVAVGGFFSNFHLRADSSIIPPERSEDFNSYAEIQQVDMLNFGVSVGYAFTKVFPKNFFLFAAVLPGIGLNFGDIRAEEWYSPPIGPFGKIHTRIAFGRSNLKNYQLISYSSDFFFLNLRHQNLFRYNFGKLKFIYGFRLENKKSPLKKVL